MISSAPGIVKSIDKTAETGTTINVDIGGGYELFYGQLNDVKVKTGDYVDSKSVYPVDCVFTSRELDDIDWYKVSFESAVAEQEGLWIKEGGPTDEEWESYIEHLRKKCGMDKLLAVYQAAYNRYAGIENEE